MIWATLQELLIQLYPYLEQPTSTMWLSIPMDTQLAVAMFKLATPTSLHHVGHPFGLGKLITKKAILEVCGTLQDMLGHTVLRVHDLLEVMMEFCTLGFPSVIVNH
ncbi:hypothetical protein Y1Q_0012450 [Alligator mississippiensis]|uniref:Uncharacterized protein n=1 Tax=Alligator mississippiensis TaxID=8496 RepID=A0A151M7Q3_ALLMI|nr:hypothetical protein Y1Q_0012450 [Alligator mississippiensis]